VFVASQAPIYRAGIRRALDSRREFRVVGESSRASDVLVKVRRLAPDVAIVDAAMPDFDAAQVIRAITRDGLTTGLVVLSAEPVRRPLVGGPTAYVPATADANAICDAVAATARGESPPFEAWDLQLPASGDTPRALSSRERSVLELTANGRGAAAIGRDLHVSEATVKTHLRHIYRKLGVSDRAAAVAEALRRGLIE